LAGLIFFAIRFGLSGRVRFASMRLGIQVFKVAYIGGIFSVYGKAANLHQNLPGHGLAERQSNFLVDAHDPAGA